MDTFDLHVLSSIADDYEAIHTTRSDLERDIGRPVSANEVWAPPIRLTTEGFADALVCDGPLRKYRTVDLSGYSAEDLWFLITPDGRAEYERLVA